MAGDWMFWALLSAGFAAATAVLAKAGTDDVDPDFANLLRTAVILVCAVLLVTATGKWGATEGLSSKPADDPTLKDARLVRNWQLSAPAKLPARIVA